MTVRIIIRATSSNENFNGGIDYAIVDITPELIRKIQSRQEMAKAAKQADGDFSRMTFYDYAARYVSASHGIDLPSDENVGVLPGGTVIDEDAHQRTDCDRMCVADDEVFWTCYPKHDNTAIETASLSVGEILEIAKENEVAECGTCGVNASAAESSCPECGRPWRQADVV